MGSLPANWTTGSNFTAAAENAVENAVNSLMSANTWTGSSQALAVSGGVYWIYQGTATTTATLPAVSGNAGEPLIIENSSAYAITVVPAGSDHIWYQSAVSAYTIAPYSSASFICGGGYWNVLSVDLAHNAIGTLPTANLVLNGATKATVATSENTTSTAYTDLTTTTDTVTVTVGASGKLEVLLYAYGINSAGTSSQIYVSFALSGANTQAAADAYAAIINGYYNTGSLSAVFLLTGLAAGSTTVKLKYRTAGNTATFSNRQVAAIPL